MLRSAPLELSDRLLQEIIGFQLSHRAQRRFLSLLIISNRDSDNRQLISIALSSKPQTYENNYEICAQIIYRK